MSPDPTDARRRLRAARRTLALCAALLALAPIATAQASGAGVPNPRQLWVVDQQDEENTMVVSYDAQAQEFSISDERGIGPGSGCAAAGDNRVTCADPGGQIREVYIVLGGGNDVLSFSEESDPLPSQLFETIIGAGGGNDVVVGGPGRNRILGEGGRDVLAGGAAGDKLVGGPGRDGLIGFGGDDLIQGGPGADALFGFGGDDILQGHGGSDTLLGGRGDDRLLGGSKHDLLQAGKGVDVLLGGKGLDRLLAKDGIRDARINCGPGRKDRVVRDRFDPRARHC